MVYSIGPKYLKTIPIYFPLQVLFVSKNELRYFKAYQESEVLLPKIQNILKRWARFQTKVPASVKDYLN